MSHRLPAQAASRAVRRGLFAGVLLCGAVWAMVGARDALAWKQYRTQNGAGCELRWYPPGVTSGVALTKTPFEIDYFLDAQVGDGLTLADTISTVRASFQAWQDVTCDLCASSQAVGCAPTACAPNPLGVTLAWGGVAQAGLPGACGPDPVACSNCGQPCGCRHDKASATCTTEPLPTNGNFVQFVQDPSKWTLGSQVVAFTLVTSNTTTGRIVDADILLNDGSFDFCTGSCGPGEHSLANTITHEVGHVLGLDHSTVAASTMYATAPAGETLKTTLDDDDRAGLCTAYRTGCTSQGCRPPVQADGGCRATRTATGWAASLGGLLAVGLAVRVRRRKA